MNSRERVLTALRRKVPDRVPKYFRATPAIYDLFEEKTGKPFSCYEEYFDLDVKRVELIKKPVVYNDFTKYHPEYGKKQISIDEWGIGYEKGSLYHFDKIFHPLKNIEKVEEIVDYPFPDICADYIFDGYMQQVEKVKESGRAAVGVAAPLGGNIFWPAYKLRGMQELFIDMYENPDILECLLDKVTAISCELAKKVTQSGIDIIWLADDFGTQKDLMISTDMWEKWFQERIYKVINAAKKINPGVIIAFHSDGNIQKIIPHLIEVGVEVLNPIQPECMEPAAIKYKYGDKLAFWGCIGTQTTTPFGSVEDVKSNVMHIIGNMGENGGLLIAPTHVLEPEVPWDNIVAFCEAVDEYGWY